MTWERSCTQASDGSGREDDVSTPAQAGSMCSQFSILNRLKPKSFYFRSGHMTWIVSPKLRIERAVSRPSFCNRDLQDGKPKILRSPHVLQKFLYDWPPRFHSAANALPFTPATRTSRPNGFRNSMAFQGTSPLRPLELSRIELWDAHAGKPLDITSPRFPSMCTL